MARNKIYKRTKMSAPIEAQRAAIVAKGDPCDNRKPHASHNIEMRMQQWLGGGYETITCPGR